METRTSNETYLNSFPKRGYAVVSLPRKKIWKIDKKTNLDIFRLKERYIYHCGDYSGEVPPVPIPNTEVKLSRAESTCRVTDREDRSSPLSNKKHLLIGKCFFLFLTEKLATELFVEK